jgi:hypothetical protein
MLSQKSSEKIKDQVNSKNRNFEEIELAHGKTKVNFSQNSMISQQNKA